MEQVLEIVTISNQSPSHSHSDRKKDRQCALVCSREKEREGGERWRRKDGKTGKGRRREGKGKRTQKRNRCIRRSLKSLV